MPILQSTQKTETIPASLPLGSNKTDTPFEPAEFGFSYSSAIGMCMYLVNTRPDIQMSTHQCARFTHDPQTIHGKAVRRTARYLKDTMDEGLIIRKSDGPIRFDCYVDADFAGLYGHEDPSDSSSVKSRSGYVFTLGGNPVHWASKLQTTIALSTVELMQESFPCGVLLRGFIVF